MSLYTVKALDDYTIFTTPAIARKGVQFKADWATTRKELARELDSLDATDAVLEIAVQPHHIRKDGTLRSDVPKSLPHPGVRLSFQTASLGLMSFTCDTYEARYFGQMADWQANVRAIVLTLEALRAVDRYGATQGEQYAGFAALPPGAGATAMGGMTRDQALAVFGELGSHAVEAIPAEHVNTDPEVLQRMWRYARKVSHPDRNGGDHTLWDQVEQAAKVLGLDR